MKKLFMVAIGVVAIGVGFAGLRHAHPARAAAPSGIWVTAYYPGYVAQTLTPDQLNLKAVTHVNYFSLLPTAGGGLDGGPNVITDAGANAAAAVVHKAGKKILITIGGENTHDKFAQDINATNRDAFVKNITDWVQSHHFDGADIDMEPTKPEDAADYQAFIQELHASLKAQNSDALLTAAVGVTPDVYKPILADFDQINVMTYDLAGTWPGWETWYTSALSNGDRQFKSVSKPMPSCQTNIKSWLDAGVPASKLGIGIDAYGLAWHGATGPNQSIDGVTTESIPYAQIMEKYYTPKRYHWDAGPESAYLSVTGATKADNIFIAYDDARSAAAKVTYAQKSGLGGVILWDLGGATRTDVTADKRSPMLDAMAKAVIN